ncbi:hypothetical protein KUCAC02_003395, partial [Chaenocephalus aceratus]
CDTESDQDDKEEKERESMVHVHLCHYLQPARAPGTHTLHLPLLYLHSVGDTVYFTEGRGRAESLNGPLPCRRELPASDKRQLFASQSVCTQSCFVCSCVEPVRAFAHYKVTCRNGPLSNMDMLMTYSSGRQEESSVYRLEWVLARPRLRLIALEYP